MDIKEDEIKEINKLGNLNGDEVKLVTLKGGLHIGIGKKSEDSKKSAILAVGSHPALVSYQISKQFNQKFEQNLTKAEGEITPEVIDYSKNLSPLNKNILGLDIYAIKTGNDIDFKITKHNFEIFSIQATNDMGILSLNKTIKNDERLSNLNKNELSKNLEKTIKQFAKNNELKIKKKF
jgi:hypothetical protein